MKKFLLTLLVFVMFTPSLSCAQFMQTQKPHMAMAGMAKDMPCCPKADQKSDMGTKFFKDCAKIDLQQAGDGLLLKKVDSVQASPYILPQDLIAAQFEFSRAHFIHGPPDPPEIFRSYPPIFLTTQRLRI
ncbi:MAG: hypothetical protein HY052_09900 [Proteobacteria bacterium]|nr:hypothetical protein [Pseudomonadota bacterium]